MAARVPLATVSQNAANARPMMGAPARKSLQGRPSLVGPTRTSTGGSNLAAPRRMTMCPKSFLRPDEPRDVKSIAFRNSAIERIIEFLVTHGYEHQISPKQLGNGGSGPSNKDFAQIFVFLYRQLDTNYKYPKDVKDFKLEDEVPAIFKMLRYPVAITKSQMSTIGAPHAWPYLLAALDWLVELLTYQQQLAAEEQDGIDPADTDKMFFLYTKRSYKAWMEDESGASLDAIERELNQQFASKNVVLEQEIQKMQAEVSLMESELATLRPSLLDDVQKQRSATLEKMDHTISENKALEVQIRELEGSISQLESDNDKRELDIRAAGNEKADLRTRIKTQPLSSTDVKRLANDRQKLDDALHNLLSRKSQAQLNLDGLQLEFTRAVSTLESSISEYRTLCTKLQLLPRGAKNAEGMDFELMLGTNTRADELAVLPIASTIQPLAVRQLELFGERLRATINEHQSMEVDIIKGEQQVAAKEAELSHMRDRIAQIDNAIALAKGSRETDCKDIISRVEMIEIETEQLRKDALARWQLAQVELDAAKTSLLETQTRVAQEREQREQQVMATLEMMSLFKLHVQQSLNDVQKRFGEILEEIEQ